MTTITKEHAQKIIDAADEVITALAGTNDDFHPDNSEKMCGLWDDLNDRYAPPEVVRELARAMLASMDAEPAGYHVIKECGKIGCSVATLEKAEKTRDFWNKKWIIRPYFYTAQPVQETGVYKDMLNIIGLLENNEWAEHCTSTVLGSLLESEITRLVGKEQPASVVPEEVMPGGLVYSTALPEFESKDSDKVVGYYCFISGKTQVVESQEPAYADAKSVINACRNAMLNGDTFRENSISSTNNFREIAETSTNSPVIPDGSEDTKRLDWLDAQNKRLNEYYGTSYGWKFDANFQRNAMMLNDSNYPVMTVRQAIDKAIAAAPQQETNN